MNAHPTVLELQTALNENRKRVTINVALEDLENLKNANYKLCFAKKVGDQEFNVVWQSYDNYLFRNRFSWTPQYQVFGSNIFKDNIEVEVDTNLLRIGLGETTVLNNAGILQPPSTGGAKTDITVDNRYGNIHLGINQMSTGIDGKQASSPIYVAPSPAVKGNVALRPVEKILVWFEQNIITNSMFSSSRSNAVEIDMTNENEATREYRDQKWITP